METRMMGRGTAGGAGVSCGTERGQPWAMFGVRIADRRVENAEVFTVRLEFTEPAVGQRYRCQPGQFNMLYLPGVGESAISVSGRTDRWGELLHTIRLAGNVTHGLAQLPVGGKFGLRGPFGTGWPVAACRGQDVVLVAGGLGLAPLRPVVYAILAERQAYGAVHVLHGARQPEGLLYGDEYAEWARQGVQVETTVDRAGADWTGHVGVVTTLLSRLRLPRPERTQVLVCGPEVMMVYTARGAQDKGIPASQVWLSLERHMNCAIGLCGHCQYGPAFICKEGPVLQADRLAPFLPVEDL